MLMEETQWKDDKVATALVRFVVMVYEYDL